MDHHSSSSQSSKSSRRPRPAKPPSYSPSSSGNHLHLPSLPRFHPANYNLGSSSMSTTPESSLASPNAPISPSRGSGGTGRFFDPEQRELSYYHQHLLAQSAVAGASNGPNGKKPESPKLMPLTGSPGPVTPLELEGESYISAGASGNKSPLSVEALIQEEGKRCGDLSPRRSNS
jgi:hypothetical protein